EAARRGGGRRAAAGPAGVPRLREHAQGDRVPPVVVVHVARHLARALALLGRRPLEREVSLPPRGQGGGRHAERDRGAHLRTRRTRRRNQADQEAEANRFHGPVFTSWTDWRPSPPRAPRPARAD